MRRFPRYFIMIGFCWLTFGSVVSAQDDTFAGTPSPTADFFSDHSYDNMDLDGTPLDPKENTAASPGSGDTQNGKKSTATDSDTKQKSETEENNMNLDSDSQDSDAL
jgi:hypothetical protein